MDVTLVFRNPEFYFQITILSLSLSLSLSLTIHTLHYKDENIGMGGGGRFVVHSEMDWENEVKIQGKY